MKHILMGMLLLPLIGFGQDTIFVKRATSPPVIDGLLHDSIWSNTTYVDDYMTFIPDFDKAPTYPTVAYMTYDEENLYFAFRCFDGEVDKIKSAVTARDNIATDDFICINLDPFNDHQGLTAFYVNPSGVQMDSRFSAGIEDPTVDLVWYSESVIDEQGYTVEVRIPLKSIRYRNGETTVMSVFLERKISRLSEQSCSPPMDPDKGYAFLTQMTPIAYQGLKKNILLEAIPAFTYTKRFRDESGEWNRYYDRGEFSLTAKYGITSDLVLDATYNPDFSQVESDAGQVDINLRYALYYPEKRPFFLEGKENYHLSAINNTEVDPVINIVHTRNILNPLVGAKLSGKLGARNTLSTLYAYDERQGTVENIDQRDANFSVMRYKRSLQGDSYIGMIYTGKDEKDYGSHLGGLDGTMRINKSTTLLYNVLGSQTQSRAKDLNLQGYTFGAVYHHDDRNLMYNFAIKDITEDFRADVGYITRTGLAQATAMIRPHLYPRASWIRRIDLEAFTAQSYDRIYYMWETFNHVSADHHLFGAIRFKVKYSYSTEVYLGQRFRTGGFHVLLGGQFNKRLSASVLYRNLNSIYYSDDPYQGRSNSITADVSYRPFDRFETEFSYIFKNFHDKAEGNQVYAYSIYRARLTFQFNRYLFFRLIEEYNAYYRELQSDILLSFTYIPGTVIYVGYGSVDSRLEFADGEYRPVEGFNRMQRGFFFKASYLFRL